jgi:hypothetical protein
MEPKGQSAGALPLPRRSTGLPWPLRALPLVGMAGVLIVACWFFRYAHALADDYSRGATVRQRGLWGAVVWERNNIGGRWAGSGLEYLASSLFDLASPLPYRLSLVALAVLWAAAIQAFISALLGQKFLSRQAAILTASLLCLYWTGSAAPGETAYWLSATGEADGAMALALLVVSGLLRAGSMGPRARLALSAALVVPTVAMTGMHDLFGAVFCMIAVIGAALATWKKLPARWAWATVASAAVAGFLFVAAAPGNAVRHQMFTTQGHRPWDPIETYLLVDSQVRTFVLPWLSDARLWAPKPDSLDWILGGLGCLRLWGATALFLLVMPAGVLRPRWIQELRLRWRFWIPLIWGAAMAAMIAGPGLASGTGAPGRTLNVTYFAFLLGWFLTAIAFAPALARIVPPKAARPTVMVLLVLWPSALLATGNMPRAYGDLFQKEKYLALPPRSSAEGEVLGDLAQRFYEAKLRALLSPGDGDSARISQARADLLAAQKRILGNPVDMGRLEAFDMQMRFRDQSIHAQTAAGKKNVGVLDLMPPYPRMYLDLDAYDISNRPRAWAGPHAYWINKGVADYYGLESIGAVDPAGE